jgi:hypothetical protein
MTHTETEERWTEDGQSRVRRVNTQPLHTPFLPEGFSYPPTPIFDIYGRYLLRSGSHAIPLGRCISFAVA